MRSFDASACSPLRTRGGGSSPHSASTTCSAGTTRPPCTARSGKQRLLLARRDGDVPIVRITNFEFAEKPDPHNDDGIGILRAQSALGKRVGAW